MADIKCYGFFFLSAFLVFLSYCNCNEVKVERKIEFNKFNCRISEHSNTTIVYITATEKSHNTKKSVVHFIWSVYDTPSIVVGYTSKYNFHPAPKVTINCKTLISSNPKGAIEGLKYDYISAFEIVSVDELSDPKDDVIFKEKDFAKTVKNDIRHTVWGAPTFNKDEVTFTGDFLGGSIVFTFNCSSEDGRGVEAPRQLYSNNGTRFSISLNKLNFNTTKTRVALKVLTHTEKVSNQVMPKIHEGRSIDDEFSPGVFRTFVNQHILNSTLSSFVAWKPVAYFKETKNLGSQIPSYQYKYKDVDDYQICKKTVPTPLVSSNDKPSKVIQAAMDVGKSYPLMISFGQKKDGWYQKNHYLTWSGQVGYGNPKYDSISSTLYITIFVGLGLPVAFIFIGSIYVCFKKYRERMTASNYGKIN